MENSTKSKPNHETLTLAKARDAKPPDSGDYILWDTATKGFGLRIYSTGARIWVAQKKLGKRPVRVHLGRFPDMTLQSARKEAEDALQKIRKGIDPNLEKRQQTLETEKARDREKLTIAFIFEEYLEGKLFEKASVNTIRDIEHAKRRLSDGLLWKLPIEAVDGEALHKEYQRLIRLSDKKKNSNGGKTAAGRIFRYLRAAFNKGAADHELKLDNPFPKLNSKAKGWQTAPSRSIIVAQTEGDLAKWWGAVEGLRKKSDARARDAKTIADWLQVALLLGGRKTESLSLKWSEIDFARGVGVFTKTKSGVEHHFPLAPHVRSILERRKVANDKSSQPSEYIFPSSRTGWKTKEKTHIKEPKETIKKVREASGISFSAHDLRRTFGTLFNELEVGDITLKKAMNHAPADVTSRHYIQTRMKTMLPIYERLEARILTEAGVIKRKKKTTRSIEMSEAEWKKYNKWKQEQKNC